LGKVYYRQTNYEDLIATLQKGHELGGGDYLTYYMLGKGYQKKQETAKAIAAFKQSAELKGDYYAAHFALGQAYLGQGKYLEAANAFKNALKADPSGFRASYNYAVAMESHDQDAIDANIQNWEEFVRIAKKNPRAKNDLAIAQEHIKDLKERKEKLELQ
jgi:tetratricopeptide (TPR) repeat protein